MEGREGLVRGGGGEEGLAGGVEEGRMEGLVRGVEEGRGRG